MGQPNSVRECLSRSTYPHWYEPLLLMVGYQVLTNREFDKPLQLAEQLLQRSAAEQVLAGDVLLTIGRERLANYDAAQMGKDGLWRRVHRALLKLATQGPVMGRLCTYTAPQAAAPVYDPRLPLAVVGLPAQRSPAWQKAMQHYWCPIEAGPFWFGNDRKGEALFARDIHLRHACRLRPG